MKGRVLIFHQEVPENAPSDEQDVLVQAKEVSEALTRLGYSFTSLGLTLNLKSASDFIREWNPEIVFNLVESVDGKGRLIHLGTSLLESLSIPYTGCPDEAVFLTSNKLTAKKIMKGADIPTPAWVSLRDFQKKDWNQESRYILKAVWEHASIGMDESSVVPGDRERILKFLLEKEKEWGHEFFAESYIEGREFNIALLDREILPVPEIIFEGYSDDQLKIVDYRAKWDEASYEYHHTPRRFDFPPEDLPLIQKLEQIALRCWDTFELSGYARVDFRVDHSGQPWVLEINTNPCLSSDGGFYAAASRKGYEMPQIVERILNCATRRNS